MSLFNCLRKITVVKLFYTMTMHAESSACIMTMILGNVAGPFDLLSYRKQFLSIREVRMIFRLKPIAFTRHRLSELPKQAP